MLESSGRGDGLMPGEGAHKVYELYQENSNIAGGNTGLTVVDETTGRAIGSIQESDIRQNDSFIFGSNKLRVVRIEGDKVSVNIDAAEGSVRTPSGGSAPRAGSRRTRSKRRGCTR